jgi:TP901 family phage tail tape measure protein
VAVKKIVKTEFTAKDNITKRFSMMERAAARFGRKTDRSFKMASKSASRFRDVTKGVVAGLGVSRGLGLVSQGLGSVIQQFIDFDKAALGATVRFKDIGPEAANFNDQLKIIRESARAAGATTEFTAAQSAEALDFLARAGFTSVQAMGALRGMINLATASGEDFSSVANMSSDLLGSFGLNAEDAAQKITNLNRLNDVLVKSANSANVTVETMFETMKTAAPIGRNLGIELEEVAALTAMLGNAGIKGTDAGTALKNSFLNLSAATPKTIKMLDEIGVKTDDGTGNMRKFTDILGDVGKATEKVGTLKVAQILDTIFGKRAIAGASGLIENIKEVRAFENTLLNAGETAEKTAEIMRQSLWARLKSLGSAATEAGFKVLASFEIEGKDGIDALTEAVRNFDPKNLIDGLKLTVDTLKIIGKTIGWIVDKLQVIGKFGGETAAKFMTSNFFKSASGEGFSFDDLVSGGGGKEPPRRVGPNQQEAAARSEQLSFSGQLNIAGAPEGSTLETGPAPRGFNVAMLGAN